MLLTPENEMVRDSIREFVHQKITPYAAKWDREHTFPTEALQGLGALGALGVAIPEAEGGAGMDYMTLVLVIEEIAAGDGSTSTIVSVQNSLVCGIPYKYGSAAQKKQWLRPLASGEKIGCFCLTEPQAGSDASALLTTAVKDGDSWVLNGVKQFITSGKNADVAIVFAVTDKAAGKKGISCFLVPTSTPGYIVSSIEEKLGQNASDTAQIVFDNCRVPLDALVGQEGEGYKIALSNLEEGRIGIAAQSVGMARAALDAATAYARERVTFGKPIIEHQAVNFRLADMAIQLDAARLMVWRAAQLKDAGRPCLTEASMAKVFASEAAEKICSDAIQIHGGSGYTKSYAVERIYRDVRVSQIYEGANDIQRMLIGRALIKGG